jgi:hypothetical protein
LENLTLYVLLGDNKTRWVLQKLKNVTKMSHSFVHLPHLNMTTNQMDLTFVYLSPHALEKGSPMELVEPYFVHLTFVASPTSMLV